jgi:hypothetical protein
MVKSPLKPVNSSFRQLFSLWRHGCLIYGPNLIQQKQTLLTPMREGNSKRRGPALRCHWRDDDRTQVVMHLRRRNDHARAGFLDLAPNRRIERDKPDVTAAYQLSSASFSLPNSPITSASSSWSAIFFAAAPQPARAALAGLRNTSASLSMVISACPSSPTCARSGFGITIPCELPMRRMAIWVRFIVITM